VPVRRISIPINLSLVKKIAQQLAINFLVAPKLPTEDGINASRLILDRCFFDEENCSLGIKALGTRDRRKGK
jgi:hypothetical protein